MEILYSISKRQNPRNPAACAKWYATIEHRGTLDFNDMAEHIARYHGRLYDEEDIKHVAALFCKYAKELMLDGFRLKLDDLGTFYLTCHSEEAATREKFLRDCEVTCRPAHILHLRMNVNTSKAFVRQMGKVRFRLVATRVRQRSVL